MRIMSGWVVAGRMFGYMDVVDDWMKLCKAYGDGVDWMCEWLK